MTIVLSHFIQPHESRSFEVLHVRPLGKMRDGLFVMAELMIKKENCLSYIGKRTLKLRAILPVTVVI